MCKKWYFTFGHGHEPGIGSYVVIEATDSNAAREQMFERFGGKWSMQYDSAEKAGVERFGLCDIDL